MRTTKRLLISMIALLCCTGVWALDRDTENYYILSSLQDWQDFASLAQTVPNINARMIADIDLSDDQTMIGSESVPYEGIFDGQGHKLTVAYSQAGITDGIGPFHAVGAATIQNLHVDGSMLTNCGIGGIAGIIAGNATIQRCWVSASMQSIGSKYTGTIGGFCSWCAAANCHLTIEDCLFDGEIVNNEYCGGFMSHVELASSSVTMRRGLNVGTYPTTTYENGTFVREVLSGVRNLETSTLFYKKVFKIAQGTQVTDDQLADGSITTTLQNDRAETVWVQDATSGQPRLDVFNHPVTTYDPYVHPTSQIINLSELTEDYIAQDGDVLTGTTGYSIQIAADATITLSDVTITNYRKSPIECLGNATINIEDGSVNRIKDTDDSQSYGRPALAFGPSGTTLTINGNTGTLIANGGKFSPGIGCRAYGVAYGGLVINGGIISAYGSTSYTNGIGAVGADDSHGSSCGDITINGGTINAAASDGIGIGAGGPSSCGAITINGGTITSHAVRGYAIGGNCSKVVISGGNINASTTTSVGIGSSGVVYIEGGTIVASASDWEGVGISGDKGVLVRSSITSLTASKGPYAANAIQGATVYISENLNDVTEGNTRTLTPKASFDPDADIAQDGEGYYLIGSAQNWKEFAVVVIVTPTANAKMTADINLGDDQTMIGSYATRYSGTFDGQGHTLTFNYNTSSMSIESGQSYLGAAPFRDIEGATIRNLRTAGSITADKIGASGLVGWAYGTNTIENCWSDVNIASSNNTADTFTGLVAFMYGTSINITDCIFTGCIQSTCKKSHSGFIGYHYSGTSALTNCLVILDEGSDTNIYNDWGVTFFTFDRFASSDQSAGTYTNCYYYRDFGVAQGTKVTDEQLADGSITTALQAGRSETVWVQDPLTNQPMLKIFANAAYTVPSSGIGTFSAKAKFALPDGLNAYYCKGYTDGQISAVAINGVVPANTGVLLKGTPGETYTLTRTNSEAATVTDNALVAVTEETFITQTVDIDGVQYTNFGLSGGVFKKVNSSGGTVKANRAYLQIPSIALSAAAEGIMLVWDEETDGISSLSTNPSPSREVIYYDLQGRRVAKPAKGLYIVNGKKVIIK